MVLTNVNLSLRYSVYWCPNNLQYEKLPFLCFSCGIMGHSELDCPKPSKRDANGKWEYYNRIRASEEKKKRYCLLLKQQQFGMELQIVVSHTLALKQGHQRNFPVKSQREEKRWFMRGTQVFSQKRDTSQCEEDVNQNLNNAAATRKRNNTVLQHFNSINERD